MSGEKRRQEPTSADQGVGSLLQRDYWAVIRNCRCSAPDVAALVRERFAMFAPEDLVVFTREDGREARLDPGDVLEVEIRASGRTAVLVVHADENSVTLATVVGHPECGRITFGAYSNVRGDVVFHIRSRARSSSSLRYIGFLFVGDPMQTNTWTDFIDRLAHTVGDGVIGAIQAQTQQVEDEEEDKNSAGPTFRAQGA